jgi:hypothetical protein
MQLGSTSLVKLPMEKKMAKFSMEGKMVTNLSRKKEMELHFPQEVWLSRHLEGLKTSEVG